MQWTYTCNVCIINSFFILSLSDIFRYIILSLFNSAPQPISNPQCMPNDCSDLFCTCHKQCTIITEYDSHTFTCRRLDEIVPSIKNAPKTSVPISFFVFVFVFFFKKFFLTIRITSHSFHLQVVGPGKNNPFHVLAVPPRFILEPEKYGTHLATRRLINPTTLPSELSDAGFAILGVTGMYYENIRLQRVFTNLGSTSSSSAPSGYSALTTAIQRYSSHWYGNVLPTKPQQPRARSQFAKLKTGTSTGTRDISTRPGISDDVPSSCDSADSNHTSPSNTASPLSSQVPITPTSAEEVQVDPVPCTPQSVFAQSSDPSTLVTPPWLKPLPQSNPTSPSQLLDPPHPPFTPATSVGEIHKTISRSNQFFPSPSPYQQTPDISPLALRVIKGPSKNIQLSDKLFSRDDRRLDLKVRANCLRN